VLMSELYVLGAALFLWAIELDDSLDRTAVRG
jgi:hypothetical protein